MRLMLSARAIDHMPGGVERMVIALMNAMVARGHEVDLFTWDSAKAQAFYPMVPAITWHRLALGDPMRKASMGLKLRRARAIRRLVRQRRPQVIIAFQEGPALALRLYTLGLGVPLIAAERNAPSRFEHSSIGRHRRLILQGLRLADRVTIQCESYRSQYPPYLRRHMVTIPNPVSPTAHRATPGQSADGRWRLLSVGRLSYQKNYPVLIEAFALLSDDFPDWDLEIVGEGEEWAALHTSIEGQGLERRIRLAGASRKVAERYAAAHAFCLPSRWEGFPNAMAEAMAHGLPCVGFAACAGMPDLVDDGRTGLLAKGNGIAVSLAEALARLMCDAALRRRLGEAAARAVARYEPEAIYDQWEALFHELAGEPVPGRSG